MASTTEPTLKREEEEEEDSKPAADDEDTGAQVAPIVKLQEVAVTTGEENEDVLLDLKMSLRIYFNTYTHMFYKGFFFPSLSLSFLPWKVGFWKDLEEIKLYRFDKEGNQWKERGVGTVKLLKHKETGKVRLVMRQNKTLKICANHLVLPTMTVQEHQGNDKSCVWHAADFADGELKEETFCIRFASVENCKAFKDKIEEITESLAKDSGESEEAKTAASLIEKLSVEGKDKEDKKEAEEAPLASEGKKDDDEKQEKSGDGK
ncbi:UNVERIFIED_CONTAM: Ran-binding protein 1c [Sesamum latifolium]|uniref:Ran-binding protein 1c n=1 Tax=Sesamum latifolium TaxID=2727402 RepID=A0AAW2SQ38_9LAMI